MRFQGCLTWPRGQDHPKDLLAEPGTEQISYDSVRRFHSAARRVRPLPFRRMECEPGQEAQVDFGTGARVLTADGKRRKTHVFRIVLSHSRKAYSEPTFTQTTDDFLRALENAFAHFGGVPKTLVIDNLKAAVLHPDWFDPVLTPKVQSFCQHYGTVILPTKPRMPRHKGKVEAGVKYVQSNGLKGRTFASLEEQNRHLVHWEGTVADTRIHGTTKQQVGKVFREVERPALLPLPRERFPFFHEAQRNVNRDGHIEVAKAYYSAPPEYLGREVWARWDARWCASSISRLEQIAVHVRHEPGKFSTLGEHLAGEDQRRGTGERLAAGQGQPDRPADAAVGRSDAHGTRHRRDSRLTGAVVADQDGIRPKHWKKPVATARSPTAAFGSKRSANCSSARPRSKSRCRFSTSIQSSVLCRTTAAGCGPHWPIPGKGTSRTPSSLPPGGTPSSFPSSRLFPMF